MLQLQLQIGQRESTSTTLAAIPSLHTLLLTGLINAPLHLLASAPKLEALALNFCSASELRVLAKQSSTRCCPQLGLQLLDRCSPDLASILVLMILHLLYSALMSQPCRLPACVVFFTTQQFVEQECHVQVFGPVK